MYTINYKILLKKMKDLNRLKHNSWSLIRKLNIVKVATLPKFIFKSNQTFTKIPDATLTIFFDRNWKTNVIVHIEMQETQNSQNLL